ncbi:ABC transporter substrate-binding protein [Phytoactinopolyspora mesophila]|uniref:ABC transporter substrate-binding protein n=1 Tax=Phytoactinopolyspora mesophila TaxID=2650750 RepID=A0A7K3M222_9ACTN|nr:ABC transporter substrate-binding protein [Phytoactinopolyspora mesophila]NDL56962.1 ABC transporter substrate-binding protein [Phytoactinopolyspora mesophila]
MRQHARIGRRLWAVPIALALVLAACQSGDDDAELGTPDLEGQVEEDDDEDADDDAPDDATEADGEELVIGRISALEGAFAAGAEDGERGVQMVLEEFGHEVAGRPIRTIVESSDTTPETATDRARKLVEQDGVHVIHGPLSGAEGVALASYAHDTPHLTIVDAASGATPTTLENPASNYFRWHSEGAMWTAPLGPYAIEELGYERVSTLAEDYAFPHAQVGGFLEGFCAAGGDLASTHWVPLGESDYSSVIASIPDDIDAMFVSLGGSDAVDFLSQAIDFGLDVPILGGSILVGADVLESEGQIRESALGIVSSTVYPPATADVYEWQDFIARYRDMFGDEGFETPSNFAILYYNSFKSLLLGIEEAGGVVEEDDGESLRAAMEGLSWDSPIGPLSLNENRQAETDVFVFEVIEGDDGELTTELREVGEQVPQPGTPWERLDACP